MSTEKAGRHARRAVGGHVRPSPAADIAAGLCIVALCLLSFAPVLAGRVTIPAEALFSVDPLFAQHRPPGMSRWQNPIFVADVAAQFYPWRVYAARSVAAGRIPLWNPYSACGMPFLANDNSAVLNPGNLVLNWLVSPPVAHTAFCLLTLLLASLSTYGLIRALGATPLGAFFGGITYGYFGFIFVWLGFPLAATAAVFPLLLWATYHFASKPSALGAAALGAIIGWQFLCGHLSTSVQTLTFWVVFAVYEVVRRRNSAPPGWARRFAVMLGVALVIGSGLAAGQLAPLREYYGVSTLAETGRSRYSGAALGESIKHSITGEVAFLRTIARGEASLLFNPEAHGNPAFQDYRQHPQYGNYPERTSYPGMLALLALVGGLLRWPAPGHRRFFLIAGWCVVGILLHLPIFNGAIYLPLVRLTSSQRLRFIFSLCAAVSLGLAASDWLSKWDARRNGRLLWAVAALLCLSAAVTARALVFVGPHLGEIPAELRALRMLKLIAPVVAAVMLLGILVLAQRGRLSRSRLGVALVAVGLFDLLVFGARWHGLSDQKHLYPMLPEIKGMIAAADGMRISGPSVMFRPNLSVAYECYDSRGYDPISVSRYVELIEAAYGVKRGSDPYIQLGGGPNRLLEQLTSVRVRWQEDGQGRVEAAPVQGSMPRAYLAGRVLPRSGSTALESVVAIGDLWQQTVIETDAVAGAAAERVTPAYVTLYSPHRVVAKVETDRPGWLVLTDTYYPGWRAQVNGRPAEIVAANYAFRAVRVPAGESEAVFSYEPASYRVGAFVGLLSLASLLAVAVAGIKWRVGSFQV